MGWVQNSAWSLFSHLEWGEGHLRQWPQQAGEGWVIEPYLQSTQRPPHTSSRNTGHSGRSHLKETARCKHTGWWFAFFIKQAFPHVNYGKKSLKEQISITLNSTGSAALQKCPEHQPGWSKTRAGKRERRFREWKTADKWVPEASEISRQSTCEKDQLKQKSDLQEQGQFHFFKRGSLIPTDIHKMGWPTTPPEWNPAWGLCYSKNWT